MNYDYDLLNSKSNSSTIKTKISPEGELIVKKLDYYNVNLIEKRSDLSQNLYFIKPEIKDIIPNNNKVKFFILN